MEGGGSPTSTVARHEDMGHLRSTQTLTAVSALFSVLFDDPFLEKESKVRNLVGTRCFFSAAGTGSKGIQMPPG